MGTLRPSGSTRLAAVIGDPVRHSLSPVLHNAAFEALGLDWVFLAFEVAAGRGADAVAAMAVLGIGGLSVTMPLKAEVAAAVDELTPDAAALGAVNCVSLRDGRTVGHNTDGSGFVAFLRNDEGFDPDGRRAVVLGAGGAARAVIHALAAAGAAEVGIVNRTPGRAAAAARLAGSVGNVVPAEAVADADLVVNATPVGMANVATFPGVDEPPVMPSDPALLGPGQLAVDLIYEPASTPWIIAARSRGASVANGLGLLIAQAAQAFRIWTGQDAPTGVMSGAAVGALAARDDPTP
ncbi:MAG TPA: shikimate dehydrogenase [Acidimicrobiales bacterium]|jgi:shikimate dehydrogenase|nr:shikimate dehydrogenase [Acidimicrobiales bacterium]